MVTALAPSGETSDGHRRLRQAVGGGIGHAEAGFA